LTDTATAYKSLLHQMTQTTPTALWNDSAATEELLYSIDHGGVGATCNPVIVLDVLKKEMTHWRNRIAKLVDEMPTATEGQIAWRIVDEITVKGAALLRPIFEKHRGKNGRLSVQTDPRYYRDPDAIVAQAEWFNKLAPNIIVKIPVTSAGVKAIEEATYRGISINATVCFTLPQCVAVAEAVERGLKRREAEGHDISTMGPVCTIMEGRLDDWLKTVADQQQLALDRSALEWAGVAVFKKTYQLYRERRYRLRLLAAAFRNTIQWSELIGGDIVISPPHAWQVKFNTSDVPVVSRIGNPVEPDMLAQLMKFEDFRRSYDENGLSLAEFDTFPATRRTLRQFITACHDLDAQIRDVMIPNPDQPAAAQSAAKASA
jgi:transaldolase